jgi:anti-repressor protein
MQIQQFTNDNFGALRTIEDDGQTLFCANDITKALGYKNGRKALADHCKGVTNRYPLETRGGVQEATFITQGDVFRLITHSKLPQAQAYERWVFDEVLPVIHRSGGYMMSQPEETPEQVIARALKIAQDTIDRQKNQISELKPKALFADAVGASNGTCLIGEMAKMLRQNGVEIGQNRLFVWLRENGYLGKSGSNFNVPTQKAIDLDLFRIKETAISHSDGHVTIRRTPKVTAKGQQYFIDLFLGNNSRKQAPVF